MLAPCYLIHGGETQQTLDITATIKKQAHQQGYSNALVFDVTAQFDWERLLSQCQNLDLFADKTFIEIRLHSESLDKHGSTVLTDFLKQADSNLCILITGPKLKSTMLNSAWVQHIQKNGKVHVTKSLPPVFKLANAILAGDIRQTIKMFNSLKNSGVDPILMLWSITREIRQLLHVKYEHQQPKRHQQQALGRLSTTQLHDLLRFSSKIDSTIKGITPGNVWEPLLALCLSCTNPTINPMPMEETTQ